CRHRRRHAADDGNRARVEDQVGSQTARRARHHRVLQGPRRRPDARPRGRRGPVPDEEQLPRRALRGRGRRTDWSRPMRRSAIVNDMRMAVEALRRVVTSVPDYEIAWIAMDGDEAVKLCKADVPDVILMDLIMPRMDGAEATRRIMRESPCAILVVT